MYIVHFGNQADEMIENLRSAMKDLLGRNEWMDKETKTKAKRKVNIIKN